jgi:hypothetical protein
LPLHRPPDVGEASTASTAVVSTAEVSRRDLVIALPPTVERVPSSVLRAIVLLRGADVKRWIGGRTIFAPAAGPSPIARSGAAPAPEPRRPRRRAEGAGGVSKIGCGKSLDKTRASKKRVQRIAGRRGGMIAVRAAPRPKPIGLDRGEAEAVCAPGGRWAA